MGVYMMARLAAPAVLVLIATTLAAHAQPADKRTWRLRTVDGQSMLSYGTDNAEDTPITFRCKPGQGVVKVFGSSMLNATFSCCRSGEMV